jgi:hypothetical protein
MKYHYEVGTTRWLRTNDDPRGHCPPKGWDAKADMLEYHPITGRPYHGSVWWICETYVGGRA